MTEVERLRNYLEFSPTTLETVAEVAERHRSFSSWDESHSELIGVSGRSVVSQKAHDAAGNHTDIIDIIPSEIDQTILYHLPMGNGLDPNMLTRLHVLSDSLPHTRIIASSNPGAPGSNSGKLSVADTIRVNRGNFRPTIDPLMRYAYQQGIETASQVGFSYGADKALTATQYSDNYDIEIPSMVAMEPASVEKRKLAELGGAFGSTGKYLDQYISAADCTAYNDAREVTVEQVGGMARYTIGLFRSTNIAISRGIGRGTFGSRLHAEAKLKPNTELVVIWGSESELATDSIMQIITSSAPRVHGAKQAITPMRIEGQRHAMGDDIFLHAALVLDGLSAGN